jgi:predicted TIM-barrel fold metal-dependent hydrolase
MIIDIHYHLMPGIPDHLIEGILSEPIRAARVMKQEIDLPALIEKAKEMWSDPDGEKLMANMDASGIYFTVVCAVDNATNEALTLERALLMNQLVANVAQKYPDRVMAFAGIDPRREEAPDMLRRCFDEFGMKGLKYHGDDGYDPAGPESYKLLEVLTERKGVLLSHTGPLAPPSRSKYADPLLLSDIGVDFPELKVIAAHMGYINWRPWAALAAHQPTLYGDLAMWDATAFGNYGLFCRELRDLVDFAGIEKVLFGTDDPINRVVRPTKEWVQLIRDLPDNAADGIEFTREEVDAILGGNAATVLGL